MFFELFCKECKQTWKSMVYWFYSICVLIFFFSQMGSSSFDKVVEPKPGMEEYAYGSKMSKEQNLIMEQTLGSLAMDVYYDEWQTYPVGFVKHVTLSTAELEEIQEILKACTGLEMQEIEENIEETFAQYQEAQEESAIVRGGDFFSFSLAPKEGLTYEAFQEYMEKVCEILGSGSSYEEENYGKGVFVPATYEDAKEEYDNFVQKDQITGAYARLFCDYMGIALGILPVFAAVTRGMRDQRAQMKELVYVRRASSVSIVLSRYLALVSMLLLPVLLASLYTLSQCGSYTNGTDLSINYFAFLPYIFGWLLPEILVVSALGFFLTELTDTAVAVVVQLIWWFADVFGGVNALSSGQYGMHLVMRHNSVLKYQVFHENFGQLVRNRSFYTVFAFVLLGVTILVYEAKRKGKWDIYGKIHHNRKRKLQA